VPGQLSCKPANSALQLEQSEAGDNFLLRPLGDLPASHHICAQYIHDEITVAGKGRAALKQVGQAALQYHVAKAGTTIMRLELSNAIRIRIESIEIGEKAGPSWRRHASRRQGATFFRNAITPAQFASAPLGSFSAINVEEP